MRINIYLFIFVILLSHTACRSHEPVRGTMEFLEKPVYQSTVQYMAASSLYAQKNNANMILIINYRNMPSSKLINLNSGEFTTPEFITSDKNRDSGILDKNAPLNMALRDYITSLDYSIGREDPGNPRNPLDPVKLDFQGTWDERTEWWTRRPQSIVGPPTGIDRVHTAYFNGDVVLSVQGRPIMKQHLKNFNVMYTIKFQAILERGLLFFPEDQIGDARTASSPQQGGIRQVWTLIKIPPVMIPGSGPKPVGPDESGQPTVGGIVGTPARLVKPQKPSASKEVP